MSDFPQGDDWWKASDDRWYAPPVTADGSPPAERSDPSAAAVEARAEAAKADTDAAMKKGCLWVVGAIVLVIVIASIASSGDDEPAAGSQFGAFDVCTKFVEDRLKAPGTAKFRNFHEDDGEVRVTGAGDGPYTVRSTVDSENGFGATIRTNFVCEVEHTGDGSYRLIDISLG